MFHLGLPYGGQSIRKDFFVTQEGIHKIYVTLFLIKLPRYK